MKIAVISANLGGFEQNIVENVKQSVEYDQFRFTDKNFPPRYNSMTPRLQARIPKCFGWQMVPDYKYYLWVDSAAALLHKDSVKWFLEQLGDNDIAVFKHPNRKTIDEEAGYLLTRLSAKDAYITSRYDGELLDDQMAEINDPNLPLYGTTAFIYRDTYDVRNMLKEWWYHISRFHTIDQISLPYVLNQFPVKVSVIEDYINPYFTPTRKKNRV